MSISQIPLPVYNPEQPVNRQLHSNETVPETPFLRETDAASPFDVGALPRSLKQFEKDNALLPHEVKRMKMRHARGNPFDNLPRQTYGSVDVGNILVMWQNDKGPYLNDVRARGEGVGKKWT